MLEENNKPNLETNEMIQRQKRKNSRMKSVLMTITSGVIGSVLTLFVVTQLHFFPDSNVESAAMNEQSNNPTDASTSGIVQQVSSNSIADIVEEVSQSIVGITNIQHHAPQSFPGWSDERNGRETKDETVSGTGSGVIYQVDDDALYIVTNHHVIEGADKIEVTLSNQEIVEAELVGTDSLTDIAVLKVVGKYDITPISFGDSDAIRAGDEVIAIGNPLGLDLYGTVTQGIVSGVNRTIEVTTSAGMWEMNVIQTDAAINPGNSGGALINTSGQLIGINSLKIANNQVEGLGFAIPSNDVKTLIEELRENGQIIRPYLGISMANVSDIPQHFLKNNGVNVNDGVIITNLDPSGSAAKAGLQVEDIIVSINGEKISDADSLRKYLYTELSVDDKVIIEFYRDGELNETEVTLTSNKQMNDQGTK